MVRWITPRVEHQGQTLAGCVKRRSPDEQDPRLAVSRVLHKRAISVLFAVLTGFLLTADTGSAWAASGETWLCKKSDYSCLLGTGYSGQDVWGTLYTGHNCVNYAAYRLWQNGVISKPWPGTVGNASQWDEKAGAVGITVNTVPAVGSVAQWESNHVAYVEVVTETYIEVSEDAYTGIGKGYSAKRRLERTGSKFAAARFIHIKDAGETFQPVTGDWNGDGKTDIGLRRISSGGWFLRTAPNWNETVVLWDTGKG
jgi:surface antigen